MARTTRKQTADQRRARADARRAKVTELRDRLGQWQENTDPGLVAAIIARFSDYSARNAQLIALQCPEATEVHGFNDWQVTYGRAVKPGEHGIQILAPAGEYTDTDTGQAPVKRDEAGQRTDNGDDKTYKFFRIAHVFDRSQTETLAERDARRAAEQTEKVPA